MKTCPTCHGDGGFDYSDTDSSLGRLARLVGVRYVPNGIVECEVCEGAGIVTDQVARDAEAWAVARVDQFLAAVDAGEVAV